MDEVLKKIHDYSLEEIMSERFARYSKYIIQDRAIPDVRDGLKPVQRRIIYAMYKDRNTYDKQFKKCAQKNDRFTVSDESIGNKDLTYPVGLMLGDEISLAGLVMGIVNSTNYL